MSPPWQTSARPPWQDRPPLGVQALGPGLSHERRAEQELARHAIERVKEAVAIREEEQFPFHIRSMSIGVSFASGSAKTGFGYPGFTRPSRRAAFSFRNSRLHCRYPFARFSIIARNRRGFEK